MENQDSKKSLAEIVREEVGSQSIEKRVTGEGSVLLYAPRFKGLPKFLNIPGFMKREIMHIYDSIMHGYTIEVNDEKYVHLAIKISDRLKSRGEESKIEYKEK